MFDVAVIGGGHAGVEAACAAARRGARTVLLTFSAGTLGAMSCNPAIGGLGKGHLVREVDAFDGVIAVAGDRAAVHHRMLNASKGMAVRGPRVQADRCRFAEAVSRAVLGTVGLTVLEQEAVGFAFQGTRVVGVQLSDGTSIAVGACVLATGTFLRGRMFAGAERRTGGRVGERSAVAMADALRDLSLPLARLKTGTPPRLDGRTIDWAALQEQPSDAGEWTLSPMSGRRFLPQVACAVTRTTEATHDAVRAGLSRSPMTTGAIEGGGPRYCPSIEDKVSRFGDRDGHQLFLEPEGLDSFLVYPNGISTSLPVDVQERVVRTIPGLDRAEIVAPGYAVEYDHVDPRSLNRDLGVRDVPGLFLAGQINGTTGYEEAAGQGLVAGINAAAHAMGLEPWVPDRTTSYLGVMIDDLVLHGVTEPYRMLTARAEYRLSLRADNAETRLGPVARRLGCVSPARAAHQLAREAAAERFRRRLDAPVSGHELAARGAPVAADGASASAFDWLRIRDVALEQAAPDADAGVPADVVAELVEDARYAPYLRRHEQERAAERREEARPVPDAIRYAEVPGLSNEMVERLEAARPQTMAQVARVRGITPAAVTAVLVHARRARAA